MPNSKFCYLVSGMFSIFSEGNSFSLIIGTSQSTLLPRLLMSLEVELIKLEEQILTVSKSVKQLETVLSKLQNAAQLGLLRDLRKWLPEAGASANRVSELTNNTISNWCFDCERYLAENKFLEEVQVAANEVGLALAVVNGQCFCSYMQLSISPRELEVVHGRKIERRLRPKKLVHALLEKENSLNRFSPERFLETLFGAYCLLARTFDSGWKKDAPNDGPAVHLIRIYEAMTLMPGAEKEYTKEEFARDIQILNRNINLKTRDGRTFQLPQSTGSKDTALRIIAFDEQGNERVFVSIKFERGAKHVSEEG